MRSIGIRVEPGKVHWAVVETQAGEPVVVASDKTAAPRTYSDPQAFACYRDRIIGIIDAHGPTVGAVKAPEPVSRGGNSAGAHKRLRIEGVVVEALRSKGIEATIGAFNTLASHLGSKSAKRYVGTDELRGLDWSDKPKELREAILAAVAELDKHDGSQSRGQVPT